MFTAQFQQVSDATATTAQRQNQFLASDFVPVDNAWRYNAVLESQRLDPHTPCVVNMTGDHAHCSSWRSRDCSHPKGVGYVFDEEGSDAVVGSPRVKQQATLFRWEFHKIVRVNSWIAFRRTQKAIHELHEKHQKHQKHEKTRAVTRHCTLAVVANS